MGSLCVRSTTEASLWDFALSYTVPVYPGLSCPVHLLEERFVKINLQIINNFPRNINDIAIILKVDYTLDWMLLPLPAMLIRTAIQCPAPGDLSVLAGYFLKISSCWLSFILICSHPKVRNDYGAALGTIHRIECAYHFSMLLVFQWAGSWFCIRAVVLPADCQNSFLCWGRCTNIQTSAPIKTSGDVPVRADFFGAELTDGLNSSGQHNKATINRKNFDESIALPLQQPFDRGLLSFLSFVKRGSGSSGEPGGLYHRKSFGRAWGQRSRVSDGSLLVL